MMTNVLSISWATMSSPNACSVFDPSVMLYAPLRAVIYVDRRQRTRFVIDRPSSLFSSFDDPGIARVGEELDTKLMTLLGSLDVDVSIIGDRISD